MIKIEDIINLSLKEYKRFWAEVGKARNEWVDLVERVKLITNDFHKFYDQKKSPYPFIMHESSNIVNLNFIGTNLERHEKRTANFNTINISLGNASIGISYEETKYDIVTGKSKGKKWESEIEHNASMTYSQMPNGSIVLVYFPTKSKLSSHSLGLKEDERDNSKDIYYIKKIYDFPSRINEKEIINAFKFLIDFSMYTSPVYRCGYLKNIYYYILFWIYRKRYKEIAKNLGSFLFLVGRLIPFK